MNILITGGSGFLGRHLCRALKAKNHSVRVLDLKQNPEFETVIGDIRDPGAVKQALKGIETVFHLAGFIEAGESVLHPYRFIDNNVLGTVVLLEGMREGNVKNFIFSSSAAVYGEPVRVPILEDDRTLPVSPYGVTKLAIEGLASSYSFSHGFTCVALRYFNLYGPEEAHEPETHAIPRFIQQINNGQEVTVWGNGEHQRDYVYISDIVDAHIKALAVEKGKFHYYNLSGKNATAVSQIIELIGKLLEKTPKVINYPQRAGDPLLLFADGSKAKRELGWEATTNLETGLKQTIDWFSHHS